MKSSSLYGSKTTKHMPDVIHTVAGDRTLHAFQVFGDMLIHAVLDFEGGIDEKRMARAARLILDAEPVFGCSYVDDGWHGHWQRCENLDDINHCPLQTSEMLEEDTLVQLIVPLDATAGPQVTLLLLRHSTHDRLIIKVNHEVADAGGVREYVYLLADIYRGLESNPDYRPLPNIKGNRSLKQVTYRFSMFTRLHMLVGGMMRLGNVIYPKKFWSLPLQGSSPDYLFHVVQPEQFHRMKHYAKSKGVTLNDLILAVLIRSIHQMAQPATGTPMKIQITVDLRRYLPRGRGEAITNLAAIVLANLPAELGNTLDETVTIVKQEMDRHKASYIGLREISTVNALACVLPQPALSSWIARIKKVANAKGFIFNAMTNMGVFEDKRLNFGSTKTVTHALTTAPLIKPPNMCIGVSGFKDQITFSAGYLKGTDNNAMQKLFEQLAINLDAIQQ